MTAYTSIEAQLANLPETALLTIVNECKDKSGYVVVKWVVTRLKLTTCGPGDWAVIYSWFNSFLQKHGIPRRTKTKSTKQYTAAKPQVVVRPVVTRTAVDVLHNHIQQKLKANPQIVFEVATFVDRLVMEGSQI